MFQWQYPLSVGMELLLNLACVLVFLLSASVITSDVVSVSQQPRTMRTIFNFNSEDTFTASDADTWWESSDTVRWGNTGLWLVGTGHVTWILTSDWLGQITCAEYWLWYSWLTFYREPGKSKASFVLQKSRLFQRAVFFAMLNPQVSTVLLCMA